MFKDEYFLITRKKEGESNDDKIKKKGKREKTDVDRKKRIDIELVLM